VSAGIPADLDAVGRDDAGLAGDVLLKAFEMLRPEKAGIGTDNSESGECDATGKETHANPRKRSLDEPRRPVYFGRKGGCDPG
jgi:hypothetical protein